MRHNHRPPRKASAISPDEIDLREGETPQTICTDCRQWKTIHRGLVLPHYERDENGTHQAGHRCKGSGQRIRIDLTPAQWQGKLDRLHRDAVQPQARRQRRQFHKPEPPKPAPVGRMANAPVTLDWDRRPAEDRARRALDTHRRRCTHCTADRTCGIARTWKAVLDRAPYGLAPTYDRARRALDTHRRRCEDCVTSQTCPVEMELTAYVNEIRKSIKGLHDHEAHMQRLARNFERDDEAAAAARRRKQWLQKAPAAAKADAKRVPAGAIGNTKGPHVPLEPLSITV